MDAYLAVVGKREVRLYQDQPLSLDVLLKILEAGRASGSSRNRQPWRFVVVTEHSTLEELATCVTRPGNLMGAAAAVAVVLTAPQATFDAGRTAQNMMLAAWTLGVGSCPNSPADQTAARRVLGLPEDTSVATILSLGYPAPGQPKPRRNADADGVLRRVNRLPLSELVFWQRYGP